MTKVHREAVRFADDDYDILLIGHEGHEEVVGTAGEAPEHITLVDGPDDVANVEVRDPEKVVWLSQTTLSVDETMETVRRLRERFPAAAGPAERRHLLRHPEPPGRRQADGAGVRPRARRRLAQLVELGAPRRGRPRRTAPRPGYLVDYADEIDEAWLDGVSTVGVTSGRERAGGPGPRRPDLPRRPRVRRRRRPWSSAEESLLFALPTELRRDLKARSGNEPDQVRHDPSSLAAGALR